MQLRLFTDILIKLLLYKLISIHPFYVEGLIEGIFITQEALVIIYKKMKKLSRVMASK
jgi:hypothetical protein